MLDNQEIYEKTKKLLRELNHFLIHVVVYFICNAVITFAIFQNVSSRWGMFFIIFAWAFALIYHAIRIFGMDSTNSDEQHLSKMWSWV